MPSIGVQFRRGPGDLVTADGLERVRQRVAQVLGTRSGDRNRAGEVPWDSSFGSLIDRLRHRGITVTTPDEARAYASLALATHVPSVVVLDVDVTEETVGDGSALRILVRFRLTETGQVADTEVTL